MVCGEFSNLNDDQHIWVYLGRYMNRKGSPNVDLENVQEFTETLVDAIVCIIKS